MSQGKGVGGGTGLTWRPRARTEPNGGASIVFFRLRSVAREAVQIRTIVAPSDGGELCDKGKACLYLTPAAPS